jgi:serine-type D-Ala-D-Ala carboxypeptidase
MNRRNENATPPKINPDRLAEAFQLIDRETERGEIPGGVALVGLGGEIVGTHVAGNAEAGENGTRPASFDTIYDCASLTKVAVTLPLILMLLDRGIVQLNDTVSSYIPEFAANDKEHITLKHLLTHTSGLESFLDMYSNGWSADEIKHFVYHLVLKYEPGTQMVYSDFGFILLGEIISIVTGMRLDQAADKLLFKPLGMIDSCFCPPEILKPRIASTEFDVKLGRYKCGEVHDDNAFALGGVSGHAGLFSTAEDLAKYAAMWLANGNHLGTRLLSPASVEAATRTWTGGLKANRGLGWVLKGDQWDASGDFFSERSYGHTGFTGTSIWVDPATDMFAVLLTNRVHFGREKSVVRLRACFHNAVAASLE